MNPKFQFDLDFQRDIIRYTLTDKEGYKALALYQPEYFGTIELTFIATTLKDYFKTKKKVVSNIALLIEKLKAKAKSSKFKKLISDRDLKDIIKEAKELAKTPVKNGTGILDEVVAFARYIELKDCLETIDLEDFTQYGDFLGKVKKAISLGTEFTDSRGLFLIQDLKARQMARRNRQDIFELPLRQFNKLTNAGGYQKASIIVILDKPKAQKTALLVNIARLYARKKKKVIVFDLENGEDQYSQRLEQSIMGITKADLLSSEYDSEILKVFRKYKRLGIEIVIKKLPAGSTTDHMRKWLDFYYDEYGLRFTHAIIDYVGKMGSLAGDKDDTQRISNAYIDVDNMANEYGLIHVWTGHHVKRDAYLRKTSKYREDDTAKSIDINRHVSAMLGLQQNDEEKARGISRLEIICQRDGIDIGRIWLKGDISHQRFDEPTIKEIQELEDSFILDEDGESTLRRGGPKADTPPPTRKKTTGDL